VAVLSSLAPRCSGARLPTIRTRRRAPVVSSLERYFAPSGIARQAGLCARHLPIVGSRSDQPQYVQYGCGHCAPAGWVNFDASPTLWFERLPALGRLSNKNVARFPTNVRYGDVVHGLPLPAGSLRGVYASHVLEHLALDDFRLALRRTFELLAPGGIFRLVVPDLEQIAQRYLESPGADAAGKFMNESGLGQARRPRTLAAFVMSWLGNGAHRWMWDYRSLSHELGAVGFVDIRRCQYGDCEDPKFSEVEDVGRFESAVAAEARRPMMSAQP
jgi:hypothetical protein